MPNCHFRVKIVIYGLQIVICGAILLHLVSKFYLEVPNCYLRFTRLSPLEPKDSNLALRGVNLIHKGSDVHPRVAIWHPMVTI